MHTLPTARRAKEFFRAGRTCSPAPGAYGGGMSILTPREVRLVAFVVGAALLGFGVKHYQSLRSVRAAVAAAPAPPPGQTP